MRLITNSPDIWPGVYYYRPDIDTWWPYIGLLSRKMTPREVYEALKQSGDKMRCYALVKRSK